MFFFVLFLGVRLESSFVTHHIPADNTCDAAGNNFRLQLFVELIIKDDCCGLGRGFSVK